MRCQRAAVMSATRIILLQMRRMGLVGVPMWGIWSLLSSTFSDWYEDRAQRMGAALAYYTIFALTPGLVIVMALAGLLLGPGAESQIIGQIRELIGEQGAAAIEATIQSARKETLGPT